MKYKFVLEVEDYNEDSEEDVPTLIEMALGCDLLTGMYISLTEYEDNV
jgi:hypothetical protein